MAGLHLRVSLEDLLTLIDQLSPEQKQLVRQRLDQDWSERFERSLNRIHADIPDGISDEEAQADIEEAIRGGRK